MNSVGEALRRARADLGLDLDELAARTRINPKYIRAIEADDRESLPGFFFYRSFVQQYASVLGIDTTEINAELDRIMAQEAPLPLPGEEMAGAAAPLRESRLRSQPMIWSLGFLALTVLACSGFYAWWMKAQSAQGTQTTQRAAPMRPIVRAPAQPPRIAIASATSAPRTHPPPPAPAPTPDDRALLTPADRILVELLARERTWLSVTSDGHWIFSGVLEPNQSKEVEGKSFAKVTVGNAAGVEVRLNGKPIGPLGAHGQVRVLVFTPQSYQVVSATREGATGRKPARVTITAD
jgi:cytoskeleton protein RodZ